MISTRLKRSYLDTDLLTINQWTLEMWKEKWHDQRKELSEVYGALYMAERENEALRRECTRLLEEEWEDVK